MAMPFSGGCMCGAVRYECAADPIAMGNCHCRDCQRATGSAFAAALLVPAAVVNIKDAFVLTSDAKRERWDISGPHFVGWEIYNPKGSPADPDRLYASQSSDWFGQVIQRSNDGGNSLAPPEDKPYQERQAVSSMRQATHGG